MRPLVYVAGPITVPEPMENTHRALAIGAQLLDSGHVVPFVPHLTCLWNIVTPRPYEEWMHFDFDMIHHCDALLRIPGESNGADREAALADELDIPVFYEVDDVIDWATNGWAAR